MPAGHVGAERVTAHARPGPRVDRLDRSVRPERDEGAAAREGGQGEGPAIRALPPQAARLVHVRAQVHGLHGGRDPERREAPDVLVGDQLRVLHAGDERRQADRRCQRVEGGAHRRVADAVDLGRDPQRRGRRRLLPEPIRRDQPHAEPAVGRRRLAPHPLHRLEEGRRARSQRAVRERLEPAEPQAVERVGPERRAAAQPGRAGGLQLFRADAHVDAQREVAARRERAVGLDRRAESDGWRERARVVDRDDAEPDELRREPPQRLPDRRGASAPG